MNILLIASYLPYPLHSGGQVRLYNLIKELTEKHKITLICEKRPHQKAADVSAVEKICHKVITVPRKKQWSLQNLLQSSFSSHSFLVTGHTSDEMRQQIKKQLAENAFDLIHVETFYVLQNVPPVAIPIVLVEHNIEYMVYQRFMQLIPFTFRPLLSVDIRKIKREEETAWRRASQVVAVSQDDKKIMAAKSITASIVANGVDTKKFSPKVLSSAFIKEKKKILFLGDFSWLQNRDSVMFIIQEIWPHLRKDKDLQLWIVGKKIPDSIKMLSNDPNIFFDEAGSSKSTPEIFQEAYVLLAPIRVGGGTSYKILESMACGTPVVTMPLSANALHATDEGTILVGKTAVELVEKTINVLQDKQLYEKISKKGRKLIEERYTWTEIGKELDKVYQLAMKK